MAVSCRGVKRQVEHAVLNKLATEARQRISALVGTYGPADRNALVRDLFGNLRCAEIRSMGEAQSWRLDVEGYVPFDVPLKNPSLRQNLRVN